MSSTECPGDKLRANANCWTLEDDAKLLDYMRLIADSVKTRCEKTSGDLNRMSLSLDAATIALSNTTNKLLTLQHQQFVENRVYDEDETVQPDAKAADQLNNNVPETTTMGALEIAVENGIKAMNRFYDKIVVDLDGSDDDDDEFDKSKSVIFRPKDPYQCKPIPYIIGSKDWCDKWHVGLVDSDDDDGEVIAANNNDVDGRSESSFSDASESSSLPVSLPSHMMSGSESSMWDLHTPQPPTFERKSEMESPRPQGDGKVTNVVIDPMPRQIIDNHNHQHKPNNPLDLFADGSPAFDKRPLARKPVNLFDESDEDEPPVAEPPKAKPRTVINLFNDNDFDALMKADVNDNEIKQDEPVKIPQNTPKLSFLDELNKKLPRKDSAANNIPKSFNKEKISKKVDIPEKDKTFEKQPNPEILFDEPKKRSKSLFDEDDEDKVVTHPSHTTTANKIATKPKGLFDDYSSDDNFDIFHNLSKNATAAQQKKQNLFIEDSDDEDFMKTSANKSKPSQANAVIFDEPPEDNFVSAKSADTQRLFSGGLFEDEVDYFDDIFKRPSNTSRGLFDEDGDKGPNSLQKSEPIVKTIQTSKNVETKNEKDNLEQKLQQIKQKEEAKEDKKINRLDEAKKQEVNKKPTSLFDNDSEDDMFSPKTESSSSKKSFENVSIAPSDVVPTTPPSSARIGDVKKEPKISKTISLFDEDTPEDEFDDLFRKPKDSINKTSNKDLIAAAESLSDTTIEKNNVKAIRDKISSEIGEENIENKFSEIEASTNLAEKNSIAPLSTDSAPDPPNDQASNSIFTDPETYDPFAPPEDIEYHLSRNYSSADSNPATPSKSNLTISRQSSPIKSSASQKPASRKTFYDGIGLFDDLPPDDDMDFLPVENKPGVSALFDDDFSEQNDDAEQKNNFNTDSAFILDDEPPPMDTINVDTKIDSVTSENIRINGELPVSVNVDEDTKASGESRQKEIIVNRSVSFDKLKELQATDALTPEDDKPTRKSPGKLNKSLNINVAALLPGGKMPSFKKVALNDEPTETPSVEGEDTVEKNVKTTHSETVDSATGRLNSLTKSRAKIQVKRRPSSAHVRKENYRKSVVIESVESNENETLLEDPVNVEHPPHDKVDLKPAILSNPIKPSTTTPFDEIFNNDGLEDSQDLFGEKSKESLPNTIETTLKPTSSSDEFLSIIATDKKRLNESKDYSKSSDEPPIDDTTQFSKSNLFTPDTKLFGSDDDDFGIYSIPKKSSQSSKPTSNKSVEAKKDPPIKQTSKIVSLFGSDDDDDDSLFQSVSTKPNKLKTIPKNEKKSLFGESDDDDDELFQTKKTAPRPQQSVRAVSTTHKQVKSTKVAENDPLADLFK